MLWKVIMLRSVKVLFYLIELINSYAAVYYSNFLFFYLRHTFGFGEAENLLTAALGGFIYIFASWMGGKLARRHGCVRMLYAGAYIIILSLITARVFPVPAIQVAMYCSWTAGVCLIWPALETLISERTGLSLPKMVGIYNITWALGSALAYFTAGLLIEKLGMTSIFGIPLGLTIAELVILTFAARMLKKENDRQTHDAFPTPPFRPADARRFLQMAWIANPFAYVAINTVIPLIPSLADKLGLSTGRAGVVCSLWMFSRLASFVIFRQWSGWHYRFRWLAGSFALMIVCFFGFLTAQSLGWLLITEIGFGLSIGLIYYSSLYYSMNVTGNQSSNAGFHEAMIGVGQFCGPALGAAALYLVPAAVTGARSVGGLLCGGFSVMIFMKYYRRKP